MSQGDNGDGHARRQYTRDPGHLLPSHIESLVNAGVHGVSRRQVISK
jgi:hypothetical protein